MNYYILHKLIEDCCYIFLAIENGKTIFLVYTFALRRFDFNYYGTLYYELHLNYGIKEKERSTGKISIIICGKYHPKKFD